MSEKIMGILNKDEKAKKLHQAFNEAAERKGLKGDEYQQAKQSFLMMLIANNPEATREMAREVYNRHTA